MKKVPRERQKSENCHDSRNEAKDSPLRAALAKSMGDPSDSGQAQPIFMIDKKGDFQNLKYGEPDRYKVPWFKSDGRGRLVGLDRRYRIEKGSDLRPGRTVHDASFDQGRKAYKDWLSPGSPSRNNEVTLSAQLHGESDNEISLQKDYLALEPDKRQTSAMDGYTPSDSESTCNDELPHQNQSSRPKSNEMDGFQPYESLLSDATHQRNLELQRRTKEDSENVEAWLALINLQDDLFLSQNHGRAVLSAKDRKIISEIRVSIYETAISKVSNNISRERLILGLMREGSGVWDLNRQEDKWKGFLTETASMKFYIMFLDFQQTNLLSHSLDSCIDLYVATIHKAKKLSFGVARDEALVYLILRVTSMLWDAGFTERAVGTWQALMELNLFRSPDTSDNLTEQFLEHFWDKEDLRIGEYGAQGFDSGKPLEAAPKRDPELPIMESSQRVLEQWAEVESMLSKSSTLPARTLDDTSEDDPYRVVMFSDVRPFMFSTQSEHGRDLLLQAFLQFAGLPPLLTSSFNICRGWWVDPFLTEYQPVTNHGTGETTDGAIHQPPFKYCIPDTAFLFAGENSIFNLTEDSRLNLLLRVAQTSIVQLLNLPLRAFDDSSFSYLAEYVVALRLRDDIDSARKLARSLLKKCPENLRLYNAYALIERQAGNFEAGERAWAAALSMPTYHSQTDNHEKGELWQMWIWQCLDKGQHGKALKLIFIMHNDQVNLSELQQVDLLPSPTSISRIRSETYLESELQQCLHNNLHREAASFVDILAILAYLSDNRDFKRIEQTYESIVSRFYSNNSRLHSSYLLELLRQNQAHLIHYHTKTSHSYQPRIVIQSLGSLRQAFAQNTLIWSLHHYHARKAGLVDRLRDAVSINEYERVGSDQREMGSEKKLSSRTVPLLLAINSEFNRPSYSGSTAHSIRAAFARAAGDEPASPLKHSPAFWKSWLSWEIEQAKQALNHSKVLEQGSAHSKRNSDNKTASKLASATKQLLETFYAALRACPWAKDLYLTGLGNELLREALGFEGCKRVYISMMDRGLRTRLDISEMLDEVHA